jgi:hypothetical protein
MKEKLKLLGIIALAAVVGLGMFSCTLEEEECANHEANGTWEISGSEIVQYCDECGEVVETFSKADLFGTYKTRSTPSTRTLEVSDTKFLIKDGSNSLDFTITNWAIPVTYSSVTIPASASKPSTVTATDYPFVFKITGTAPTPTLASTSTPTEISIFVGMELGRVAIWYSGVVAGQSSAFTSHIFQKD